MRKDLVTAYLIRLQQSDRSVKIAHASPIAGVVEIYGALTEMCMHVPIPLERRLF